MGRNEARDAAAYFRRCKLGPMPKFGLIQSRKRQAGHQTDVQSSLIRVL